MNPFLQLPRRETNLLAIFTPNGTHLIEHDAALAEANQHQLGLIQIEIFTPPQWIVIGRRRRGSRLLWLRWKRRLQCPTIVVADRVVAMLNVIRR